MSGGWPKENRPYFSITPEPPRVPRRTHDEPDVKQKQRTNDACMNQIGISSYS